MRALPIVALTLACGGGGSGPRGDVAVEMGTGTAEFVPIGDTVELIAGPQGGFHIDVTARVTAFAPQDLVLHYEILHTDGEPFSYPTGFRIYPERVVVESDDVWVHLGGFAQLRIDAPAEAVDQEVELRVLAQPTNGDPFSDDATARIVDAE